MNHYIWTSFGFLFVNVTDDYVYATLCQTLITIAITFMDGINLIDPEPKMEPKPNRSSPYRLTLWGTAELLRFPIHVFTFILHRH